MEGKVLMKKYTKKGTAVALAVCLVLGFVPGRPLYASELSEKNVVSESAVGTDAVTDGAIELEPVTGSAIEPDTSSPGAIDGDIATASAVESGEDGEDASGSSIEDDADYEDDEEKTWLEKKKEKSEEYLAEMEDYDYYGNSITEDNKSLTLDEIDKLVKGGKKVVPGPSRGLYKKIMGKTWIDETAYKEPKKKIKIDLANRVQYATYVSYLKAFSRYDGVYLYNIGHTEEGRTIYSLVFDKETGKSSKKKKVIIMSGLTHAREMAGGMYMLKYCEQLSEHPTKYKKLLDNYKVVIVPWLNIDVSQAMINNPWSWNKQGGLYKANIKGTDLNRNYPALAGGWLADGVPRLRTQKPCFGEYAGKSLGCAPETQAMMKWFYHYIAVEKAVAYIDFHQQGRIVYSSQSCVSAHQCSVNNKVGAKLAAHFGYSEIKQYSKDARRDLDGSGETTTQFALSVSCGKYSPKYGGYVYWDGEHELAPVTYVNPAGCKKKGYKLKQLNKNFLAYTVESGSGVAYTGGTKSAFKLNKSEYYSRHFDTFLNAIPNIF